MDPVDQAIIAAIAHGHTDTLLKNGLEPELIRDDDARAIYRAALDLIHRSPPSKPNRVNLLASTWAELRDPETVKGLISLNGTGEVPPDVVVKKVQDRHLSQSAQLLQAKLNLLLN